MTKLVLSMILLISIYAENIFVDKKTKLVWEDTLENFEPSVDYYEAEEHCSNLKIGKHTNFRIPTMDELQTLIDYKKYKPAIIDGFNYVENEPYWTSTPFADDDKQVWLIHFQKGERMVKDKHYDRYIRCVESTK